MSNIQLFNPSSLPAFARNREISAAAKALAGGSGGSGKRISIKGGVFRLIADGKEVAAVDERFLDVVIVNTAPKVSRTFYVGTYQEGQATPPTCWSGNGETPDKAVRTPQYATCAMCPQNAKGSGKGDSRACRYSQRLAVVLANDIEGDVMQLTLAATSLFGREDGDNRPLQAYARYLIAQNVDPTMLVTRMKFDTKAPVPKLFFKPERWLTDDEFATCQKQGMTPEALKAVEMTVAQQDGVVAAPLALSGSKPAPAPVVQDDDEPAPAPAKVTKPKAAKPAPAPVEPEPEDEVEPVVRAAPAKPAPSVSSIAATLAAWDDE